MEVSGLENSRCLDDECYKIPKEKDNGSTTAGIVMMRGSAIPMNNARHFDPVEIYTDKVTQEIFECAGSAGKKILAYAFAGPSYKVLVESESKFHTDHLLLNLVAHRAQVYYIRDEFDKENSRFVTLVMRGEKPKDVVNRLIRAEAMVEAVNQAKGEKRDITINRILDSLEQLA